MVYNHCDTELLMSAQMLSVMSARHLDGTILVVW